MSSPADKPPMSKGSPQFLVRDQAALLSPEAKEAMQVSLTQAMLKSVSQGFEASDSRWQTLVVEEVIRAPPVP